MSQTFVKRPDNGPHSALAGLGVLRSEQPPADPADVLRRIVAWRDDVHAGRVVRSADLEALIEEGRRALGVAPTAPTKFTARPLTEREGMDANFVHGRDEYDYDPFIRKFCEVNGITLIDGVIASDAAQPSEGSDA